MGNVDSLPVVSQVKSAMQACQGDMQGALETQERFSKQCPVVSQVRSAVEAHRGDHAAALATQREFLTPHNLTVQAGLAAGDAAAPLCAGAALTAAGFKSAGIAAGSWAAALMASYGGAVPAGSLCALLQSAGAAGLPAAATAVLSALGVSAAAAAAGAATAGGATAPAHDIGHGEGGDAAEGIELLLGAEKAKDSGSDEEVEDGVFGADARACSTVGLVTAQHRVAGRSVRL
jgi:Interferon-induced 6-16 family